MATKDAPKTIGDIIDRLERLREELLTVQRALEKMECPDATGSKKS